VVAPDEGRILVTVHSRSGVRSFLSPSRDSTTIIIPLRVPLLSRPSPGQRGHSQISVSDSDSAFTILSSSCTDGNRNDDRMTAFRRKE
jgi:hypothetical protein